MIRTRDFFLFLIVIIFLLIGIGSTLLSTYAPSSFGAGAQVQFVTEDTNPGAIVLDTTTISRAERMDGIRQKIAAGATLFIYEEPPEEESPEEILSKPVELVLEQRCQNFQLFSKPWDPAGLSFRESEGVRLLSRDISDLVSTSTAELGKELVLALSMSSVSAGNQACIPSDVIGITIGGTLIRNASIGVFGSFGEDILIGYALDGYPIYGATTDPTDICGGRTINAQYRYQVSIDRETIIQCYSGSQVTL